MSDQQPTASATSHPIPGGEEVDVTITIPTPAGECHPDAVVVPADAPGTVPRPAGSLAPDVPVVSPPTDPAADPTATPAPDPAASVPDLTPSGHPADIDTTTAGAVAADRGNVPVIRPDDPDATPTPATDLAPSTTVIDPAAAAAVTVGPVTPGELTAVTVEGNTLSSEEWSGVLAALDAGGFRVVRK